MTEFQLRKIRKGAPRKPLSEKTKQNLVTALGIVFLIIVLYLGGRTLLAKLESTWVVEFVTGALGKDLRQDNEGNTQILLVGVGGEAHEGKDLTDTIIIASLNSKEHRAALLSLPRDLYVESSLGGSRVNRLYEQGKIKWGSSEGLDFTRQSIEDLLGVPIHYTAKVDFEAFDKVVDSVGGIDVFVEQTIDDPLYPKGETYEYETFFLAQGNQHLDGETALKYVRSRKTSSDFDRSRRQHQVLVALKNKVSSEHLWNRKSFFKQLWNSLQEHVETTLSLREMLTLAEFGAEFDAKNLSSATLNDEPVYRGGFLYTPLRELYGGAYVLLPAGDSFDFMRQFVKLIFYGPPHPENFPIAILNGTETSGFAAKAKSGLQRYGIKTIKTRNASLQDKTETTWYVRDSASKNLLPHLQALIPGKVSEQVPEAYMQDPALTEAKIILELGANAKNSLNRLDIFKNVFSLIPSGNGSSTTENSASPENS